MRSLFEELLEYWAWNIKMFYNDEGFCIFCSHKLSFLPEMQSNCIYIFLTRNDLFAVFFVIQTQAYTFFYLKLTTLLNVKNLAKPSMSFVLRRLLLGATYFLVLILILSFWAFSPKFYFVACLLCVWYLGKRFAVFA